MHLGGPSTDFEGFGWDFDDLSPGSGIPCGSLRQEAVGLEQEHAILGLAAWRLICVDVCMGAWIGGLL